MNKNNWTGPIALMNRHSPEAYERKTSKKKERTSVLREMDVTLGVLNDPFALPKV